MEGLAPIIKDINKRIEDITVARESMYEKGEPQDEIDKLTSLIRELNAAVSDVIPKYSAQAQKLDFDGDEIEIHAAKRRLLVRI
jgi:glyceraldehyde-3-phosphate dehydrogenase/erythrose-4-phosphate dehydrogenase